MVVRGTTPALIGTALMLFVLGLEAMEPLSQEVDQPDRTDSLPIERGELLVRHLVAPAIALDAVRRGRRGRRCRRARDHPGDRTGGHPRPADGARRRRRRGRQHRPRRTRPHQANTQQAFVPPEMAGISSAMRVGLPILVSALAASTVLLVRQAERLGNSTTGGALRGAIGAALLAILVGYWVRRRDHWRRKFRQFVSDGQTYTKQQRSNPA